MANMYLVLNDNDNDFTVESNFYDALEAAKRFAAYQGFMGGFIKTVKDKDGDVIMKDYPSIRISVA